MQIEDHQTLTKYLLPHEKLQWVGRPPGGLLFRKSDMFLIPFSLVWGGLAFWGLYFTYNTNPIGFSLPIAGIFVGVVLYMIFGRFVIDMLIREDTIYGLTGERALIESGLFSKSLKSVNLKSTPDLTFERKADDRGTIIFGPNPRLTIRFINPEFRGSQQIAPPSFEMIENVTRVYQMIQEIQRK